MYAWWGNGQWLTIIGMMPGILKVLENVAKHNGLVWEKTLAEWKTKGQWHVEVRENVSYGE